MICYPIHYVINENILRRYIICLCFNLVTNYQLASFYYLQWISHLEAQRLWTNEDYFVLCTLLTFHLPLRTYELSKWLSWFLFATTSSSAQELLLLVVLWQESMGVWDVKLKLCVREVRVTECSVVPQARVMSANQWEKLAEGYNYLSWSPFALRLWLQIWILWAQVHKLKKIDSWESTGASVSATVLKDVKPMLPRCKICILTL